MNKLRKWILKHIFGIDMDRMDHAFDLALECHELCERIFKANGEIIADYKRISNKYMKLLDIVSDAEDMEDFRHKALEILKEG